MPLYQPILFVSLCLCGENHPATGCRITVFQRAGSARRISLQVNLVMLARRRLPGLANEAMQHLDSRPFLGKRPDMHDLRRRPFRVALQPHLGQQRQRLSPRRLRVRLFHQFRGDEVRLHDHHRIQPVLLLLQAEGGHILRPPQSLQRHHPIIHLAHLAQQELERVGQGEQRLHRRLKMR